MPSRIPVRVRIHRRVSGDFPFHTVFAMPGDYPCECNRYGAVSVKAMNGEMLGLRPAEFEALEYGPNPAFNQRTADVPEGPSG